MENKINSTKLRIASEAAKLFAKKGYASTSMEDIMVASNASKGSIYYHFKNKEDLFLFILEQQGIQWKETWNIKEKQFHTATEKLIGITKHYLEDFKNPLFSVSHEFTIANGDYEKVQGIIRNQYYDVYQRIFQEGINSKEFLPESTETYMYTFLGMHIGLDTAYYDDISFEALQKLYMTATNIFIKGIQAS
ncbi:TetR/AcrR family transcriptional regulator [Bacillus sp. B1-b2]|uniref:TetR/AcrR family transcriptional regulator n=1 Tax=Bacillus sp. B1-b2 TaxID=2653201 RepID=UPI0012614297|nr:TetR/AcrR family transcriptional regulator [Bacillus sp. B1-b2]KAB7667161.1 TetR family transcriptional regulator [Bacillus sp. B1-b2]